MRTALISFLMFGATLAGFSQYRPSYNSFPPPPQEEEKEEEPKKGFDPSRLVFGGNLGMQFGDYTFVNVTPQVGYLFSPMFTAGAGVNYIYSGIKHRDFNGNEIGKENYGYAGMNVFGRFFPVGFLFLMAQPEVNYSWGNLKFNGQPEQKLESAWVPTFLIGGGAMLGGRGGRGGMMLSVQYDAAQDPRSPYGSSAFISMGFAF